MMLAVGQEDARRPSQDVVDLRADLAVLDLGDEADAAGAEPTGGERGHLPRLSRRRLGSVAAGAALSAGLAAVATHGRASSPASEDGRGVVPGGATASSRRPGLAPAGSPSGDARRVTVLELGRPLLGATAGWDLFARGSGLLVRIHPASGHVALTTLPGVGDDQLSVVPVRRSVLVHPLDYRRGYVVPDDRPAADLPLALNGSGPLLPGPDDDRVWVPLESRRSPGMMLVTLDGLSSGVTAAAPPYVTDGPLADGAGYLLFQAIGGIYRAGPGRTRRVSDGALLAVGPPGWLTVECDDDAVCRTVLHARRGGNQVVPAAIAPQSRRGVLSPDGATVALPVPGEIGTTGLVLVDLRSGDRRAVALSLIGTDGDGTLAWSPDGRWLFAVDSAGQIEAVDPRSGRISSLIPGLPTVVQLAVRRA